MLFLNCRLFSRKNIRIRHYWRGIDPFLAAELPFGWFLTFHHYSLHHFHFLWWSQIFRWPQPRGWGWPVLAGAQIWSFISIENWHWHILLSGSRQRSLIFLNFQISLRKLFHNLLFVIIHEGTGRFLELYALIDYLVDVFARLAFPCHSTPTSANIYRQALRRGSPRICWGFGDRPASWIPLL